MRIFLFIILSHLLFCSVASAATPNDKATSVNTEWTDEYKGILAEDPKYPPEFKQNPSKVSTSVTIDSAAIYNEMATHYAMDADFGDEARGYAILFTLYGGLATAAGIGLFSIDYGKSLLKYPGYGLGGFLVGTGAIALFCDLLAITIIITTTSPSESWEKSEEYRKKAENWKLKVKPAINFSEPGAGLLLQLTF